MSRSRKGSVQVPGAKAPVVEQELAPTAEQETVELAPIDDDEELGSGLVVGGEIEQFSGPASDDAATEAGQAGRAHKIDKPRLPLAPADLGGMPDVTRPPTATINANKEMTVAQAMELDRTGKLQRAVMTSSGWYVPRNSQREQSERRRNGQPPLVEID